MNDKNVIGENLTFDLYLDDKLFAIFNFIVTSIKAQDDKRFYLRGSVDSEGLFRDDMLSLIYSKDKGTFKRPSGNSGFHYKFVLNTNTCNPTGAHNALVLSCIISHNK